MPNLQRAAGGPRARKARAATWIQHSRPWRVVPLALFAIVATTSVMGAAERLFWHVSNHRYADDILRQKIALLDAKLHHVI